MEIVPFPTCHNAYLMSVLTFFGFTSRYCTMMHATYDIDIDVPKHILYGVPNTNSQP